MDFKFKEQESYTLSEIKEIISQHNGYKDKQYKDYKSADEFSKLEQELKPFKEEARSKQLLTLLPEKANKDLSKDIIRLTDLNEDMSDEDIAEAFGKTIADREYLQAKKVEDPKATKVVLGKKQEVEKELTKESMQLESRMANL